MPATREFPDYQRMPRIDQNALSGHSKRREQFHQKPNGNQFEADDGEFHPSYCFAYARRQKIRGLGGGRVHRVRVITAIDLWINLFISQVLQMVVGGCVEIWIDLRCLDAALAIAAVNITPDTKPRAYHDHSRR